MLAIGAIVFIKNPVSGFVHPKSLYQPMRIDASTVLTELISASQRSYHLSSPSPRGASSSSTRGEEELRPSPKVRSGGGRCSTAPERRRGLSSARPSLSSG